jgi:hypothetical protein
MFDTTIREVYSLDQEVAKYGEIPKKTSDKFMTSEDVTLLHFTPAKGDTNDKTG